MSDFDDPELERILGRSGGPFPDVERLETAIADLRDSVERLAVGAAHARRARGHVASHAAPIVMAAVRALADQAAP